MFKLKFLVIYLLIGFSYLKVNGQSDSTGFFIILDKKKGCVNPFKSLTTGIPLCLSKHPIVSKEDFEYFTDIRSNMNTNYVELKISKNAFTKIQLLNEKLPKTTLALVIDGTIFGTIENIDLIGNPLPIYSSVFSNDIELVYEKLKKVKIRNKP